MCADRYANTLEIDEFVIAQRARNGRFRVSFRGATMDYAPEGIEAWRIRRWARDNLAELVQAAESVSPEQLQHGDGGNTHLYSQILLYEEFLSRWKPEAGFKD